MKKEAYRNRVKRLREELKQAPFDTLWVIQPENRRYLSGFTAEDGHLTESSGSLLITTRSALLVTDSRYITEAEKEAVDFKVILQKKALTDILPDLLARLKTRKLGFEEDFLIHGTYRALGRALRKRLPGTKLVPVRDFVESMRAVKETSEVTLLKKSADRMSDILDQVIPWMRPGMTEKEVAWRIEDLARENGTDGMAFPPIVGSGPNGALPHAVPTDKMLRRGEPIVLDVGVRWKGYCSDMTRTVFLDEPAPRFREIYRIVREAQLAGLREVKPGVMSDQPDRAAREIIKKAGYGDFFGHGLGHGVGLATHEAPRLSPLRPVPLQEGMVVTVEPGIYLPGKGGVRLEEMVLVRKKAPRILTRAGHFYDF